MKLLRITTGVLLGLIGSLAVAYGLMLQYLSLGFDGPGKLTLAQAATQVVFALMLFFGGLSVAFGLSHVTARRLMLSIAAVAPGAAISVFLLNRVIREAVGLI
ncbi:MAG: hypothetical protein HY678_03085 [Chloroflexi bacterium]|nr:hypothetical protein [Chloroflexota bacterium]